MPQSSFKHARTIFALLATVSMALAFQNCGTQSVFERHSASAKETSESNGNGYQGKIYVQMGQCGAEPWVEKNKIIVSHDGVEAHELINECTKLLLPNLIPASDITFGTDSIQYMARTYVFGGATDNPLPLPTPPPASTGGGTTAPTPAPTPPSSPPTAASLNLCQTTTARVIFHCKDTGSTNTTLTGFQSNSGSQTAIACAYSGANSSSFSSPMELTRDAMGRIMEVKPVTSNPSSPLYTLSRETSRMVFDYQSSSVRSTYVMSCTEYP